MPEPNWERMSVNHDYIIVHCPNHPDANPAGYVYLHRIAMENYIGRFLKNEEHVHHKDENKWNNDEDNLQIVSRSEHARIHHKGPEPRLKLECPQCGSEFQRRRGGSNAVPSRAMYKRTFCSRSCAAKFYFSGT